MYYYLMSPDEAALMGFECWLSREESIKSPENLIICKTKTSAIELFSALPHEFVDPGIYCVSATYLRKQWKVSSDSFGILSELPGESNLSETEPEFSIYLRDGFYTDLNFDEVENLLGMLNLLRCSPDYNYESHKESLSDRPLDSLLLHDEEDPEDEKYPETSDQNVESEENEKFNKRDPVTLNAAIAGLRHKCFNSPVYQSRANKFKIDYINLKDFIESDESEESEESDDLEDSKQSKQFNGSEQSNIKSLKVLKSDIKFTSWGITKDTINVMKQMSDICERLEEIRDRNGDKLEEVNARINDLVSYIEFCSADEAHDKDLTEELRYLRRLRRELQDTLTLANTVKSLFNLETKETIDYMLDDINDYKSDVYVLQSPRTFNHKIS